MLSGPRLSLSTREGISMRPLGNGAIIPVLRIQAALLSHAMRTIPSSGVPLPATGRAAGPKGQTDAKSPRLVAELALRHHEVMLLMMSPLHHNAHEAESLELCDFLRVRADDHELHAV